MIGPLRYLPLNLSERNSPQCIVGECTIASGIESIKIYKASDRDGMYVTVSPGGTVTFRYDYYLNGRRETLTLKRYGPGGISLAMARCAKA